MELLILLVERQGELVSRDEIAGRLWGQDVFVDVEHGINTAVRKVRMVLRDDPEKPRFVETVVGKGYRFAAPVTSSNGEATSAQLAEPRIEYPTGSPSAQASPALKPAPSRSSAISGRFSRFKVLLGMILLAIVVAVAADLALTRHAPKTAGPAPIRSLAVLPLKNLSGDASQEYLADGLTEGLIGRLARIHDLRVISRTSVMRFKDTQLSVPEIAKSLGVDAVVEGSVIREGSQIRVHAQLIRAGTDAHLWADEYQRELGSILAVEDDLTRNIAGQIEITLTPQERGGATATQPIDAQTQEQYLKGRYYFNQRTEDAVKKSIEYFKQAIVRNPNYALAYSGLADDYALLGFQGAYPSKDALAHAKAAALKAIELDGTLGEPHASLGFIAETHEWDWATAEREYKRALELNPGDVRAHHWYAGYLMYVGRFEEGIAEAKRARDLDPLSLPVNNALAGRLLVAGRSGEALQQVQKTLELNPNFASAHQTLGWVYLNQGKREEALREFQRALELSGSDDTDIVLDLGFAYATAGKRDEANKILTQLKILHEHGGVPSGSIGILYGALGNRNEAFAWLNRAYDEHDPQLTYLKVPGRRFEPVRHDPRFKELVRRVGLPD